MNANPAEADLNEVIGRILVVGTGLSAVLIGFGIVLMVAAPPVGTPSTLQGTISSGFGGPTLNPSTWLSGVYHGDALSVLQLGTLVLLSTPLVRVGASVLLFVKVRDWTYVGITVLVLAMLLAAIFLLGPAER